MFVLYSALIIICEIGEFGVITSIYPEDNQQTHMYLEFYRDPTRLAQSFGPDVFSPKAQKSSKSSAILFAHAFIHLFDNVFFFKYLFCAGHTLIIKTDLFYRISILVS